MGYCYSIRVYCCECGWSKEWKTSDTIQKGNSPGQKSYEINLRMIAGFREIGQGLKSMETFSRCLNMPPPMSAAAYNNIVDKYSTGGNNKKHIYTNRHEFNILNQIIA